MARPFCRAFALFSSKRDCFGYLLVKLCYWVLVFINHLDDDKKNQAIPTIVL